jgi:ribosomal protein S18 acetylase RimI-like enzyme
MWKVFRSAADAGDAPEMSDVTHTRPAAAADLPVVARMAATLVRMHHALDPGRFFVEEPIEPGYEGWLRREIRREGAIVLVATRGERVVGYAYGTLEGRDWERLLDAHGAIHDVFVEEAVRRDRVGEILVEAITTALFAAGAPRIVLSTAARNEGAQSFFRALGFRPTLLELTRDAPPDERGRGRSHRGDPTRG